MRNYIVECILAYYLKDNKVKEELVSWEKIDDNKNIQDFSPAVCNFVEIEENEIGYAICYYESYNTENELIDSNLKYINIDEIKRKVKKMDLTTKTFEYITIYL